MDSAYELYVADGILNVVFRGVQDFETTERAIAEGAKLLTGQGIGSVLFDFESANADAYFTETVRHAERAEKLGLSRQLRLAFYSPRNLDTLEFMATVAVNRGYTARAFTSRDEALLWLKRGG
jgi:hypothetical protein